MKKMKKNQTDNKSKTSQPSVLKEIDKLKKQIEDANSNIKQTEKLLDVDLFLKQQKQKRLQHAKNINADYEEQKKIREQKLYKKHNREKRVEENQKIQFKTQNIRTLMPLDIVKVFSNKKNERKWVKEGHHYRLEDIEKEEYEDLRKEEERMFMNLQKNQTTQKMKYDGDSQSKHIVWKNIKEVVDDFMQIKNLPISIEEGQLSPLSQFQNLMNSLVMISPQISERLYKEDGNIVICEFFGSNKMLTVFTDKYILVRQFTHKYVNICSRSHNKNVMWPTIIQKAYRKMKKFDQIPPSETSLFTTIYEIYGLYPEFIPITNKNIIKENFPFVLGHLLQESKVGFLNINHHKTIFNNRIYLLDSVRQFDEGAQKQIKYKIRNPWRGNLLQGQNLNFFTILELLELFNVLVILKDYPKKWKCLRIPVSYFSNGAVSLSNNEWTKNPQYLFTIVKPSCIRIILRKSGADLEEEKDENPSIFGFLLFQNKEADNKISCMKMDVLLTKTKSNDLNEATYSGELLKGNYILIPYCTKQSKKSYQFYTLDFLIERQDNIHFGKARYFDYNYQPHKASRLNNDQKVIQSLENVEKFDKPKVEPIDIPKLFKQKNTKQAIEQLKLTIYKNAKKNHFFIPGFIGNLLINKEIQVQIKPSDKNMKKKQDNEELTQEQQGENLSILLGYDVLDDDINQGKMHEFMDKTVDCFDFRDFCLGSEGLTPILQCLSQYPQVVELDLRGNEITDTGITYICYYLEKSDRIQIRKLDVSRNAFGRTGKKALEGLKLRFPKLTIIGPGFVLQ